MRIASVGELLWDMLPEGPQLGGAPANFAATCASLSALSGDQDEVFLISAVGDDELGQRALEQLNRRHVDLGHVPIDPFHTTGTVAVTLDSERNPHYRIREHVAWDHLTVAPATSALATTLDAICFGTLAQRTALSRATIHSLIEATPPECLRVFDVNLRAPFWTPETVRWGCAHATILKMSEEEATLVLDAVDPNASARRPLDAARLLIDRFPMQMVAITRGRGGSLLATRESVCDHSGISIDFVDPIGAGDAFAAALTRYALHGCGLAALAEAANGWGAWVASRRGGMPVPDLSTFQRIESSVELSEEGGRCS